MSLRVLAAAITACITLPAPFAEASTTEAPPSIDGVFSARTYLVVENGQDTRSFIRIVNNKGRTLTASYSVVPGGGTAREHEDFDFPPGSVTLVNGDFADLPITVFAEPLPHFSIHETFEIMARVVAYGSWSEGESIEERLPTLALDRLGYRIDRVLFGGFGFQAYGLTSDETFILRVDWSDGSVDEQEFRIYDLDRQPILAIRGTNDIEDFFTDLDPNGIGFDPFDSNKEQVEAWLREVSDPENQELFLQPHITGHSLGGAMTQWFAASYTHAGRLLGQVVTFNSPGIPERNSFGQGAAMFDRNRVASVTHYVTAADFVSLAGERFLPARSGQSDPHWVKSSYLTYGRAVLPGDSQYKHSVPVLAPFYDNASGQRYVNPVERATPFFDGAASLSDPDFSFDIPPDPDVDYMLFMLWLARTVSPEFAAKWQSRSSVEQERASFGDKLFNLPPFVETPELFRAGQAASRWVDFAWSLLFWHGRLLIDLPPLQKGSANASTAGSFWEAAPYWPEAAWAASEQWPEFAWEVMCGAPCGVENGWTPEQWASTLDADFPWDETVSWSREDWEGYEPVPTRSLRGKVWEDLDGDGVYDDVIEPGRVGQRIYVDLDRSGTFDGGSEPSARTQGDGSYDLRSSALPEGEIDVRQELDDPDDWRLTFPADGKWTVQLTGDPSQVVESLDFGNQCTGSCSDPGEDPPNEETIVIGDHAFLRNYTNLQPPLFSGRDIRIPVSDYVCGVVGFDVTGGDLLEYVTNRAIVGAWVRPTETNWRLHYDDRGWDNGKGDEVEWKRISILCFSTEVAALDGRDPDKPIFRKHFEEEIGDNVRFDTGVRFKDYACGIAGFVANNGDINEDGSGDIIQAFLYEETGSWRIRADFRTHNSGENWDVDMICVSRDLASYDGAAPGKPYFFDRFESIGDDAVDFDTRIPASPYVCGIAGLAARGGDIFEGNRGKGAPLMHTYMVPEGSTWRVKADFRTHGNHETWDVNVFCALKDGVDPDIPVNLSHEEKGLDHCMDGSSTCQVLRDELITLSGPVIVTGGGLSGEPSRIGHRCGGTEYVEVYVNDRDPLTGEPMWSWPDRCLLDGQSITLSSAATYDLRGASVVGGTAVPFELRDPDAAPQDLQALPKLFTSEFEPGKAYGPGMALTWRPTVHPQARYYDIQFSEDGGASWSTYTASRDVSYGGWINHHSNLYCGANFYRCLKRVQAYSYRVRVLRADTTPLTDWSEIVTRTSFDWPAHVELDPPSPPGPYDASEDVTLRASAETYGQGLTLEWSFTTYKEAEYTILSGCRSGSAAIASVRNCEIQIRNRVEPPDPKPLATLAAGPEASVDVLLTGTDTWGFVDSDKVSLVFEDRKPPVIDSVDPMQGGVGSVITIRGRYLEGAIEVTFGDVPAGSFTVDSSLQIRAEVPPDAGSRVLRVRTPDGTAIWDEGFTFVRDIPLPDADFDGDGTADAAVWNPDDGMWRVLTSSSGFEVNVGRQWGTDGDIPMAGDFDGDGKSDMTVWRPSNGVWYVRTSSSDWISSFKVRWGTAGDVPLVDADFDGDAVADMAFWRPADGYWHVLTSSTDFDETAAIVRQWGTDGDVPLAGTDLDGDGRDDMAVFRPGNGYWYSRASSTDWNGFLNLRLGQAGDIPLAGTDFDGDGRSDLAVWRPSNGYWYVRTSSSNWSATVSRQWGTRGDLPLPRTDIDGDAQADMAVWRPTNGTWYDRISSTDWLSSLNRALGVQGDVPLPGTDLDGDGADDMVVWAPTLRTWCARLSSSGWAKTCLE